MVKLKIAQTKIDNYRKTVQLQKRKISLPSSEADTEEGLGATIYRTIEVHDSLIDYLGKYCVYKNYKKYFEKGSV